MKNMNVVEKILSKHLVEGDPKVDPEIGIRIDQTLTQDGRATYRLWHTFQYALRFYLCFI